METNQQAYDLSRFEPTHQPERLKVVENKNKNKLIRKRGFHTLKLILITAMLLALTYSVLASQTKVTELSSQITQQQEALQDAKATGDYLNNKMGSSIDMTEVSRYAEQQLGLVKMDSSQVEYIMLEQNNEIEVPKSEMSVLFNEFNAGFMSIMEYLAP